MPKTMEALLVEEGVLSAEQMEQVQKEIAENGGSFSAAAAKLGFCTEEAVAKAVASARGTKYINLSAQKPEVMAQVAKLVPGDLAHKYTAFPVTKRFDNYTFAVVDPLDPALFHLPDELFRGKRGEIQFWVSGEAMIKEALETYFPEAAAKKAAAEAAGASKAGAASANGGSIKLAEVPDEADDVDVEVVEEGVDPDSDGEAVNDAPVIKWVNSVIFQAVEMNVSDIHLDPMEQGVQLRYRVDGSLQDVKLVSPKWRRAIPAVIKVKTKQMKIEEKRSPQDAKIKIKVPSREKPVELRVSTLPTAWGEKVVMRILDSSRLFPLEELGFEPEEMVKLERAINAPQGMLIVTGPTGSGKTNTLYSALHRVNERDVNIITAEKPVEFMLPGINQVNIVPEAGMTFAAALKAFLRQDPDIILVGEVRDYEEAEIAVTAAMTGHLVLTTLHTNDAPSTVSRLLDMRDPNGASIDPGTIAAALNIVMAQRLVKPICKNCKEETTYEEDFFSKIGLDAKQFEGVTLYKGKGCSKCSNTGYKGRTGIFEMIEVTRGIRDLIMERANANVIRDLAIKEGMKTLRQAAIAKVKGGITTVEQVVEATSVD